MAQFPLTLIIILIIFIIFIICILSSNKPNSPYNLSYCEYSNKVSAINDKYFCNEDYDTQNICQLHQREHCRECFDNYEKEVNQIEKPIKEIPLNKQLKK